MLRGSTSVLPSPPQHSWWPQTPLIAPSISQKMSEKEISDVASRAEERLKACQALKEHTAMLGRIKRALEASIREAGHAGIKIACLLHCDGRPGRRTAHRRASLSNSIMRPVLCRASPRDLYLCRRGDRSLDAEEGDAPDLGNVAEMVVYGLGSPCLSGTSRHQLAIVASLAAMLPRLRAPVMLFDPVFR